ncbi:MAG: ATPase P [Candidatus Thermofonsia Clade 1 bacterium]|uniref:ATPase P n=1 Tax=Candidatus Thermofonsia Clade 1 bacterium TaxID=2364210 RepID=A0A2M8PEJ1_9CHLR|nr:MAG: ATPase P [Candidatus Thermofonsia Clade 1 bacterium]PJF42773.1 MAG: ATPase P [Candidatus Thermofonsia Clade 1 bacterium]
MSLSIVEMPIQGMDCHECTLHVQRAIAALDGVRAVDVFLSSQKARVALDPERVSLERLRAAVQQAGYSVPLTDSEHRQGQASAFTRRILMLFGIVIGLVLFIVVIGEWLGFFERLTALVPYPIGTMGVLLAAAPILRNVLRAAWQRQITAHTLMSLGMAAALIVGEWATAGVVVFLMYVGTAIERMTAERTRRAVKDLTALAPQTARLWRAGAEQVVPIGAVQVGDEVIVRPGEAIPTDGVVCDGHATVNQATITGESLPVEVSIGAQVYAATLIEQGYLRVRVTAVGEESTFGRIIRLVEEAEAHRADIQRIADRFASYYLPFVLGIAALTLLLSRNALAAAAVLVVACSCSFALATPIAMLASIGASAKRGVLIKGGKYIEALARADVLLIDKTGTLTLGKPCLTDVIALADVPEAEILRLAAAAERYSEHPLAAAVRAAAAARALEVPEPKTFEAIAGMGVRATVEGQPIAVGNARLVGGMLPQASALAEQGKALLYVARGDQVIGILAAADTLRPEVPAALAALRQLGVRHIELLTGDNAQAAQALCGPLGLPFRANLLPEDKIRIVREYQAKGHTVVMIGDGVNDAPALAQADVGIAMGAAGSPIAIEAAQVTLMSENWRMLPQIFRLARRTMRVVHLNIGFTAIYNLIGLTLAALGLLPPVLAAAAQSIPDIGIVGNSARLLRATDLSARGIHGD